MLLFLLLVACGRSAPEVPETSTAVRTGTVGPEALSELSGIDGSDRGEVLWAVNDSGNPPTLFALAHDGSSWGQILIEGATNRDWEDLAWFALDGRGYLLVADVGDNTGMQGTYRLYVIPEPSVSASKVKVAWTVTFRYPDGARDCEAVAVDTTEERIVLLSKRDEPPVLYDLPLRPADGEQTARRLGEIRTLPAPTEADRVQDPKYGGYRSWPTALDITSDGRTMMVQTYKDAYLYTREPGEPWAEAVARPPRVVDTPQMAQTEAACLVGNRLFVTTEQHPAPLYRVDLDLDAAP